MALSWALSWENINNKTCSQTGDVYLGYFYDVNLTNDEHNAILTNITNDFSKRTYFERFQTTIIIMVNRRAIN